jgi:NAD-dependent deacetylase
MSVASIAGWLRESHYVVVLTGAGISTESGIPDFRGPQGVWTRNPGAERTATLQHYLAHAEARVTAWQNRLNTPLRGAEPNAGHMALAELERKGKVQLLVTQNVDGLHLAAGSSLERMIEIHGNVRDYMCMGCDDRGPLDVVLDRVREGEADPPCKRCGGVLKTATVSFGQQLFPGDMERAEAAAARADFFLAVGTSLTVFPVAYLPETALRSGARLVIVNAQETPYDRVADAVVRGRIGEVLPEIVSQL